MKPNESIRKEIKIRTETNIQKTKSVNSKFVSWKLQAALMKKNRGNKTWDYITTFPIDIWKKIREYYNNPSIQINLTILQYANFLKNVTCENCQKKKILLLMELTYNYNTIAKKISASDDLLVNYLKHVGKSLM